MDFSIIGYDPIGAWTKTTNTIEELLPYQNAAGITWININELKNVEALGPLIDMFGIHPLTVEDILDTEQRPKAEEFDTYLFITFKIVHWKEEALVFNHIGMILTEDTVITFQETAGDSFNSIRRRIMHNIGKIRKMGPDYLAYVLMDSVVDDYILALDKLGLKMEEFEDRAIDENDESLIPELQRVKQMLLKVRRLISPLRESLMMVLRMDSDLIKPELEPFLKDLQDHLIQSLEIMESYREMLAGVMEVNLGARSNRMNKVMKVLTIISTIFIPLTFIVGVYGMNFAYMPELSYPYAYPITWGIMVLIAIGMLIYFKQRHWL